MKSHNTCKCQLALRHTLSALAVLVFLGWAAVAQGAEKTWNADAGDYFTPIAWQPAGVPSADDDVIIAKGTVTLPESATVKSLTLSGTLIFANGDTTLKAGTFRIRKGGLVTVPGSFLTEDQACRVSLVGADLSVDEGGAINVDGKGYANRRDKVPSGPGGARRTTGSGSHGGKGGCFRSGLPYGSVIAPTQAGSAGGTYSGTGGDGGGIIRIQATGSVIVNGRISANGLDCVGRASPGAGGSIFITCGTFAGTAGAIEAMGGNVPPKADGGGGGGGGRIALVFDKAAQRKQPPVTVRFSADGGKGDDRVAGHDRGPGEPGTLFLSDADILKSLKTETPPPQPTKEKAPHDTK
jgi:hypothetical protein